MRDGRGAGLAAVRLVSLLALACAHGVGAPSEDSTAPVAPAPGREGPGPSAAPGAIWRELEAGLEMGVFPAPRASAAGDSKVRVLRIDPAAFEMRLLNASAPDQGRPMSAKEWCRRNDLVAATNASMYQTDRRTSVSLMKTRAHTNNLRLSKDRTVLAFDRLEPGLPPVKLIDRECDDLNAWRERYGTLVQSIRMISCKGKNVWQQQPQKWSTAALGIDSRGRVLLIHVRSPYSTHDLIEILMDLPLELAGAMYLEGGPEAQLYVRAGGEEHEFLGSHGTGAGEDDGPQRARPIPNVIGVARRRSGVRR